MARIVQKSEGYLAAATGKRLSDNPYAIASIEWRNWRNGWFYAVECGDNHPAVMGSIPN